MKKIEVSLRVDVPYSHNTDLIGCVVSGGDFEETLAAAVADVRDKHQARLDIESKGGIVHRGGHVTFPPNYETPVEFV